jgi:aspartate aminotransferase
VANRFSDVERPATVALLDVVQSLRAQGVQVLNLGGGEPDFATAEHIVTEASAALYDGFTHYTPGRGLPTLLDALGEKLWKDNGIAVDPATQIVVTPSAKHALFATLMTILDTGDEILVPTPSRTGHRSLPCLVGARPVPVELDARNGFRLTRQALGSRISGRTRALLLGTPNNPTGRALTRREALEAAAFAADHDLLIVADETYEKILFTEAGHISMASLPGCADRTITVNGFSKSHAMTGWRLGYLAGPADIVAEVLKVQEHTVGCAGSFVQRGGLAALNGPENIVQWRTEEYATRRARAVTRLNAMPGITCPPPEGTFYAFPDITGTGFDSDGFAGWLLGESGVAVTPGSVFGPGGEGHVRLSFAVSTEVLETALDRMAGALARIN